MTKKFILLQKLEIDFSDNTFTKSLVCSKSFRLDDISSVPDQYYFQLSFFKTAQKLSPYFFRNNYIVDQFGTFTASDPTVVVGFD